MAGMLTRWITCENPTDRQRVGAIAVPQCRAGADLQGSLSLSIPVYSELLPDGLGIEQDVLNGWQAFTNNTGTPDRMVSAFWRWFMEHCIQSASRDEGHLLIIGMQTQFQHTVGRIAHEFDGAVGKPSPDQANHLVCPHPHRLV